MRPLIIHSMVYHQMHRSMPATFIINRTARGTAPLGTRIKVILEHLCEAWRLSLSACFAVFRYDHVVV